MSVKAMSEVWEHSKAQGNALVLMLAIADHVNESTGTAWPSLDRLAKYANLSKRRVIANINRLVASGELVKMSGGMGPRDTNEYRISFDEPVNAKGDANGNKGDVSGNKGDADGKKGCRRRHPIPYRTVIEPLNNIKGDFEDFWKQFPYRQTKTRLVKEGKGVAKTSYNRALKKISHEQIMTALAGYNPEPKYACMPATWLNQERWNDETINTAEQSDDAERIGRTSAAFEKAAAHFLQRDTQTAVGDERNADEDRKASPKVIDARRMDSDDGNVG